MKRAVRRHGSGIILIRTAFTNRLLARGALPQFSKLRGELISFLAELRRHCFQPPTPLAESVAFLFHSHVLPICLSHVGIPDLMSLTWRHIAARKIQNCRGKKCLLPRWSSMLVKF